MAERRRRGGEICHWRAGEIINIEVRLRRKHVLEKLHMAIAQSIEVLVDIGQRLHVKVNSKSFRWAACGQRLRLCCITRAGYQVSTLIHRSPV